MGRNPIIRQAVLQVLKNSPRPLRFNEIKKAAEEFLHRNKPIADKSIAENLLRLINGGLVKKFVEDKHVVYALTNHFFNIQAINEIKSLFEQKEDLDFFIEFEDDKCLPYAAFIQKPAKNLDLLSWDNPTEIIAERMIETVNEMDPDIQDGIIDLFAWAYWCGTRKMIKSFGFAPLPEKIRECKEFAFRCLKRAEGEWRNPRRVEAEKALIKILEICDELISKPDLREFLQFLFENTLEVKKLQGKILKNVGHWMSGEEKIWDHFLDFHYVVTSGLDAAGLVSSGKRRGSLRFKERHFYGYSKVWGRFIEILAFRGFKTFNYVKGELEEVIPTVRTLSAKYLDHIKELPFKSKTIITYLWGFPEIFSISDKSFLPWFEDWFEALKRGDIDHRAWIFSNIEKVAQAYRAVKSGKEPRDDLIDIDIGLWTFRDLYRYHPRGKDVDFWEELLYEIKKRAEKLFSPSHL